MNRRLLLALAAAALAAPGARLFAQPTTPSPAQLLGATGDAGFIAWLNDFYARSLAAGVSRGVLDRELSGLSPDPRVAARDTGQPEFAKPVSVYVMNVVTDGTVALGRQRRAQITQLPAIERAYGVPAEILIAVWAME